MPRRFFQSFQQRIESGVCDLMRFVKNINLESIAGGAIPRGFAQLANFIDAAVGGCVDFNHVNGITGANLGAGVAYAAWLRNWLVRGAAVPCHCQNARERGFADPAMPAEDVAMSNACRLYSVF